MTAKHEPKPEAPEGDPRVAPVPLGVDERGLERSLRLDTADNQVKEFVENTGGYKDPDAPPEPTKEKD
jgi:hypothetical protein